MPPMRVGPFVVAQNHDAGGAQAFGDVLEGMIRGDIFVAIVGTPIHAREPVRETAPRRSRLEYVRA